MQPGSITCPNCGKRLRITRGSRLLFVFLLLSSVIATAVVCAKYTMGLAEPFFLAITASVAALIYLVVWPCVIRVEKWASFRYWLPKSRLVGYTVYLLLPILFLVGLFSIAVTIKWGM